MSEQQGRAAREIVSLMSYKSLFLYQPGMEISVPETDRKNSLDKIAFFYRSEEITISDLFIGYAVSLYKYTIPKVIADTVIALGKLWPEKNVPRYISREGLMSRVKKMCGMGMLRRFVFQKEGNNIVLYSTTAEFAKVIYQALKLSTDARQEKDILPPLEILEKAASSLVSCELMNSPFLTEYNFMPSYYDGEIGRITFNAEVRHTINGQEYVTVVEPLFTKVDIKRFTKTEWQGYLHKKMKALRLYLESFSKKEKKIQLIIVCEDAEDFKLASTWICTDFPEHMLANIYFTSEGALKSSSYKLKESMIRITSVKEKEDDTSVKILSSVTSRLHDTFF